jgi:hypothetical protein
VEATFDLGAGKNKRPPMPVSHPHYGGLAIWAMGLIERLRRVEDLIKEKMYFVPKISIRDECEEKLAKLQK